MKRESLQKMRFRIDSHVQFSIVGSKMNLIIFFLIVACDPPISVDAQRFEKPQIDWTDENVWPKFMNYSRDERERERDKEKRDKGEGEGESPVVEADA